MRVNNINGTSDRACRCGSWLDHWIKFSGQNLRKYCSVSVCFQTPEVGAHIQKDSFSDKSWYIIPLCKTHNGETGKSLEISDNIKLVSANVSATCGGYR
jgi:hypothetical protein